MNLFTIQSAVRNIPAAAAAAVVIVGTGFFQTLEYEKNGKTDRAVHWCDENGGRLTHVIKASGHSDADSGGDREDTSEASDTEDLGLVSPQWGWYVAITPEKEHYYASSEKSREGGKITSFTNKAKAVVRVATGFFAPSGMRNEVSKEEISPVPSATMMKSRGQLAGLSCHSFSMLDAK